MSVQVEGSLDGTSALRDGISVVDLDPSAVVFPFGDPPYVKIGTTRWGHQCKVDPTPGYRHDKALTLNVLKRVAHLFPIDWPVTIWLLPAEDVGRTNGSTFVDVDYDGPQDDSGAYTQILGTIEFGAKRIPIHPALTRYLVPHEYGHVVEEWLNKQRDGAKLSDGTLLKEYAEVRGIATPDGYGAGLWHRSPCEVFADDFRLLVCGMEWEFWPHPGIERPENVPAVLDWWKARTPTRTLAVSLGDLGTLLEAVP